MFNCSSARSDDEEVMKGSGNAAQQIMACFIINSWACRLFKFIYYGEIFMEGSNSIVDIGLFDELGIT